MSLLASHGLDQAAGVRLCNARSVTLDDGRQSRFEAIDPIAGIRGLAASATHAILVHEGRMLSGMALLCKASGTARRAASLRNSKFLCEHCDP